MRVFGPEDHRIFVVGQRLEKFFQFRGRGEQRLDRVEIKRRVLQFGLARSSGKIRRLAARHQRCRAPSSHSSLTPFFAQKTSAQRRPRAAPAYKTVPLAWKPTWQRRLDESAQGGFRPPGAGWIDRRTRIWATADMPFVKRRRAHKIEDDAWIEPQAAADERSPGAVRLLAKFDQAEAAQRRLRVKARFGREFLRKIVAQDFERQIDAGLAPGDIILEKGEDFFISQTDFRRETEQDDIQVEDAQVEAAAEFVQPEGAGADVARREAPGIDLRHHGKCLCEPAIGAVIPERRPRHQLVYGGLGNVKPAIGLLAGRDRAHSSMQALFRCSSTR